MPFFDRKTSPDSSLALWRIEEDIDYFEPMFPAVSILNENKRLQWYATRHLVNELVGQKVEVVKDEFGKPYLTDSNVRISLSHTPVYAAAMLSSSCDVGVDLEMINPKVERIAHKFLYEEEIAAIHANEKIEKLILYWSAKEALYKLHGRRQLEFKTQMLIAPFELQLKGELRATLKADGLEQHNIKIDYEFFNDHVLTYITGR